MCAAAEFLREISHGDDADSVAVLFAKECHCAGLLGILEAHDLSCHGEFLRDLLVDDILDLLQFLGCHRLEVREVKTCTLRILIRACLFDMRAENFAECLLQKVRRRVVAAGCKAVLCIDLKRHLIAEFEHAGNNMADVCDLVACHMLGGLDLEYSRSLAECCLKREFLAVCLDPAGF